MTTNFSFLFPLAFYLILREKKKESEREILVFIAFSLKEGFH